MNSTSLKILTLFVFQICVVQLSLGQEQATQPVQKLKRGKEPKANARKTDDAKSKDAVPKKETEFDPKTAKGMINEISKPLSKILKFKRKGGRLAFDLPSSYSEADGAFREIRTKARGGGGGHGSGNFWTQYVSGQSFGGRIQKSEQNFGGGRKVKPDSLVVEFLETADNASGLEVQAEDLEKFTIRVNGGLVPYYLQLAQTESSFSVQEVNGHYAYAGTGSDFESFCKNNPDYVQERLLPILSKYGVASPVTRFNATTRDHVLALLSPADDKALQEFKNEFKDLESTKYEQRQAASKKLNSEFEKWKDVIRYAVGSDHFSLEVRSRLQKLIKDKSSEADRQLVALVASGDLANDTDYLVWLLGQAKEAKQSENVINKLKSLTKKDFGDNVDLWKKHLQSTSSNQVSTGPAAKTNPSNQSLVNVDGYLPQMAEPTANLLQLKLDNNKISLDRKHWADQFNGETIETLVTRLQDQIKKSNLPKRWLNAGGHSLNYVRHEHVLFEHIQTVIPPQFTPNHYSYGNISGYHHSSINRKIEQPHIFLRLNLEKLKRVDKFGRVQASKNKPDVFQYSVRERRDFNLELSLVEHNDSSLSFAVACSETQTLFHLHQSNDGKVSCHLLNKGNKQTVAGENFKDLYTNEKEFLSKSVYPIFARFGVQIPKELGGPLEIKNAPKPKKKS